MQSNQKAASYLFSPLSAFSVCFVRLLFTSSSWLSSQHAWKAAADLAVFARGHLAWKQPISLLSLRGLVLRSSSSRSQVIMSHSDLCTMLQGWSGLSLTGQWGLNEEPLHTGCHATSGSKTPTLRAVSPSGRVQSWFHDSEPGCSFWHFRWTDPSNDASPRVMFSNERLPFFFDSLHDRSRRRQALSVFLILTFSLSWGWTWLAPAPPALGEMTHSLFFKTQSNILTFELLRVSGMIRLILTALVLFFTARSSGCCRRDTRDLYKTNPRSRCVCILSQKSSRKKGYIPFSRCLTEVGLHNAFARFCETQVWTRGSVNVQRLEKKKVKRDTSETSKCFFFF